MLTEISCVTQANMGFSCNKKKFKKQVIFNTLCYVCKLQATPVFLASANFPATSLACNQHATIWVRIIRQGQKVSSPHDDFKAAENVPDIVNHLL